MDSKTFIHFAKKEGMITNEHEEAAATKLVEAMDVISNVLNGSTMNQKMFNHCVDRGLSHPTLKQNFNRFIFGYISYMASDEYKVDGRNESSKETAQKLVYSYEKVEGFPFFVSLPNV